MALAPSGAMEPRRRGHLHRDLVDRGLPETLARAIAEQVAAQVEALPPSTYEAFVAGVTASHVAHRGLGSGRELGEIQRLMRDFNAELQKLDEALEVLAAYVVRMRGHTAPKTPTLH